MKPHHHLGVFALKKASDARQGLENVNRALHKTCKPASFSHCNDTGGRQISTKSVCDDPRASKYAASGRMALPVSLTSASLAMSQDRAHIVSIITAAATAAICQGCSPCKDASMLAVLC